MTDRKAMEQALEALDYTYTVFGLTEQGKAALSALRERLAQPEQEPVDAVTIGGLHASVSILSNLVDHLRELLVEVDDVFGRDGRGGPFEDGEFPLIDRVRAQIAAISPPERQEPVGCEGAIVNGRVYADRLEHDYKFECEAGPLHLCTDWVEFRRCFEWLAQHTSPPAQRTWVGLTDEMLADCVPDEALIVERDGERTRVSMTRQQLHEFANRAIEAARGIKENT